MNQFTPEPPERFAGSLLTQLLVGLLLVGAVPVGLWVLADPATALLTVTVAGLAGLSLIGGLVVDDGDGLAQ